MNLYLFQKCVIVPTKLKYEELILPFKGNNGAILLLRHVPLTLCQSSHMAHFFLYLTCPANVCPYDATKQEKSLCDVKEEGGIQSITPSNLEPQHQNINHTLTLLTLPSCCLIERHSVSLSRCNVHGQSDNHSVAFHQLQLIFL